MSLQDLTGQRQVTCKGGQIGTESQYEQYKEVLQKKEQKAIRG